MLKSFPQKITLCKDFLDQRGYMLEYLCAMTLSNLWELLLEQHSMQNTFFQQKKEKVIVTVAMSIPHLPGHFCVAEMAKNGPWCGFTVLPQSPQLQ